MIKVQMGNAAAVEAVFTHYDPDDYTKDELIAIAEPLGVSTEGVKADIAARISAIPQLVSLAGNRVTRVEFPDGVSVDEAFISITATGGVWGRHSTAPPSWCYSDDADLQEQLCMHYGCAEGEPTDHDFLKEGE